MDVITNRTLTFVAGFASALLTATLAVTVPASATVYTFRVDLAGKKDFDGNALQLGPITSFDVSFNTTLGANVHGEGPNGSSGYFVSDSADGAGAYGSSPLDAELMSVSGLGANGNAIAGFYAYTVWSTQPGPIGPADSGGYSAFLGALSAANTVTGNVERGQEMNIIFSWNPPSASYPKVLPSEATFTDFLQTHTLNASFTAHDIIYNSSTDTTTALGVDYYGTATLVPAAAVPEPTTWVMMIIGFGAIGGAMRQRKSIVGFA